MYVFIDESGNFGFSSVSTKFLVIACVICEKPLIFDGIIKKMRRYRFKEELDSSEEIKANHSSPEIRNYMIEKLNEIQSAALVFLVINKKKYKAKAGKKSVDAKSLFRDIYKYLKEILREFHPNILMIDNLSPIKGYFKDLRIIFEKDDDKEPVVEIHMANSNAWGGLQFSDLLAWSCFRAYEKNDFQFRMNLT